MFHFNDFVKKLDIPKDIDMSLKDLNSKVPGYVDAINDLRQMRASTDDAYNFEKYYVNKSLKLIKLPVSKSEFIGLCNYFASIITFCNQQNNLYPLASINANTFLNTQIQSFVSEETIDLINQVYNTRQALAPFKSQRMLQRESLSFYGNFLQKVYEQMLFVCQIFDIPTHGNMARDEVLRAIELKPCVWEDITPMAISYLYHIKQDIMQYEILNTAFLTISELEKAKVSSTYTICAILAAGAISAPTLVENKDAAPLCADVYEQLLISKSKLVKTMESLSISYKGLIRFDTASSPQTFMYLPEDEPVSLNEFPTCNIMLERFKLFDILYANSEKLGMFRYRGPRRSSTLPITNLSSLPILAKRTLEILSVLEVDLKDEVSTSSPIDTSCKLISDNVSDNINFLSIIYGTLRKLQRNLVVSYHSCKTKSDTAYLPEAIQAFTLIDNHIIYIPFLMGINRYKLITLLFPNDMKVLEFLRVKYFDRPTDPLKTLGPVTEHFKTLGQKAIELLFKDGEVAMEVELHQRVRLSFDTGTPSLIDINSYFQGNNYTPGDAPNNKNLFWEVPLIYSEAAFKHRRNQNDNYTANNPLTFGEVQAYKYCPYYFQLLNNLMKGKD